MQNKKREIILATHTIKDLSDFMELMKIKWALEESDNEIKK